MAEKDLKVRITGDASQLGGESKKAVDALNAVKGAAMSMLVGFTGGLLGGGIAGSIKAVVSVISDKIRETRELIQEADKLDISTGALKGARRAERTLNLDGTFVAAMEALRQGRSDAMRGEPNAVAAFKRLEISLAEIEKLAPDKLFARVADVFKGRTAPMDKRQALAMLVGKSAADDLTPYFAGGGESDIRRRFGMDPQLRLNFSDLRAMSRLLSDPKERQRYRMEMEPLSMYGVGDEEKANRIARENEQRALAVKRASLSIEEQIAAVTKQRAALEKAAAEEANIVKKRQLEGDVIGMDAELVRLKQEAERRAKPVARLDEVRIPADEFAQRGIFIGGTQRVPGLLQSQLVAQQAIERVLRDMSRDNERNWG